MTRHNPQKIYKHMSYTITELSEVLEVSEKTCFRWIEEGLPTIPDSKKPILILGSDAKEFLRKKNLKQKVKLNRYQFYCFKCRGPTRAKRGSIEEKELKKQIIAEINKVEIPPEFCTFGMKWFRKENAKEVDSRTTVLNAQQKAYNAVVAKIDGLTDMRAAQEITPEEFAEKRASLLLQKKKLSGLLNDTDARIDKWIKTGDEMLDFIENAKAKFQTGSMQTRRGILSTLGSDLVIKDKMLSISIDKSLFPLKSVSKEVGSIMDRLEPLNTVEKQKEFEDLCLQNPVVLRYLV